MRKLIRFNDNDGFTVIELLMAIIILGVVMAAITTMIVQSFNVFDSSTRRMSAGQLAELGLSEVGGYLRSATEIVDDNGPWKFRGYHPNIDEEGIDEDFLFVFNLEDKRLLLNVYDEDDTIIYNRTIINNVMEFEIEINGNEFVINIKVEDGEGNIARKRLSVSSRNLENLD